jgi:adenine-specific DNA methylase
MFRLAVFTNESLIKQRFTEACSDSNPLIARIPAGLLFCDSPYHPRQRLASERLLDFADALLGIAYKKVCAAFNL